MTAPTVSIIIPTYNDNERLARCLAALEAQDYPGPFEIIVVDNGSMELPVLSGRARLLEEARPGSYNARNRGLAEATGEVLAFTDSDCRPHPGWLSAGVRAVTAAPDVGLVGGAVRIMPMSGAEATLSELYEMAVAFPQESYVKRGRFAATANMITRRDVMDKIGPFSSRLRSGGDADWGQRTAGAGYRLVYADDAVVDHPARSDHREVSIKMRRTVGGERDRRPEWTHALRFSARQMLPPRSRLRAALSLPGVPLSRRLQVAGYCLYINWIQAIYRLELQLSGGESSRI